MMKTTYAAASVHLDTVLGIDLERHLEIRRPSTLKYYAVLGALLVIYRYAEALGQRLIIHDMTDGGTHVSHALGTEIDFDHALTPRNAVQQINMASDLLAIREVLRPYLTAFRIGVYFDRFDNVDAKTFEEFKEKYGKSRPISMHHGLRYPWRSADYRGAPKPMKYDAFSIWGKGTRHYGKKELWAGRIRSWNIGYLRTRASLVANTLLADFLALDRNPPTTIILGAGLDAGPV